MLGLNGTIRREDGLIELCIEALVCIRGDSPIIHRFGGLVWVLNHKLLHICGYKALQYQYLCAGALLCFYLSHEHLSFSLVLTSLKGYLRDEVSQDLVFKLG